MTTITNGGNGITFKRKIVYAFVLIVAIGLTIYLS